MTVSKVSEDSSLFEAPYGMCDDRRNPFSRECLRTERSDSGRGVDGSTERNWFSNFRVDGVFVKVLSSLCPDSRQVWTGEGWECCRCVRLSSSRRGIPLSVSVPPDYTLPVSVSVDPRAVSERCSEIK